MQPVDVLIELRKLFSTTKAQRVIPILRRDSLLWNALQDDAYFQKLVAYAGDEPERWNPAVMALVALVDHPEPGQSVSELADLIQKTSQGGPRLLNETRQVVRQPKNLIEAGNLALALRQRLVNQEPGRVLLQEIMPLPGEAERPALLIWQTPLAILTGIAADPLDVLRSLMPKRISTLAQQWVCHAVFSNPFDKEKKADIFTALFTGLPPAQQLSWLRQINMTEQGDLVVEVARRLLTKTSISSAQLLSKTNLDLIDIETAIVRCLELQRLAGLYRFANQPANAKVMLQKAQSIVQHWLAGLSVQDADLAALEGQQTVMMAALQNALTLGGSVNGMQSEILLSVGETAQAESLMEQLSDQTTNPISQIFLASRVAKTGETEFAKEMANRAVELWLQQISRQPLPFTSQFAIDWHPMTLIQALIDLQLPQQAVTVAVKLQEIRPADASMNLQLSRIYDQLGDTRQALVYGQFATAITPENAQAHAWLSTLWGKLGSWEYSFQEQHQAIFLMTQPSADDWAALARCAVMLKDWVRVEEACEQALAINPDQGSALAMKGQAYLETGKLDEAGKLLSRATLLAPEEAETWLQLARLYQRINNSQRAMETLRAAVLAVPSSAEINFALARTCLENGLTSDALPFLRKASSLNPGSIDIAVDLGETLCVLGHVDEAINLIEQARVKWPQHPRLAYTHAQAALSCGSRETALKALEVALESNAPEFTWYLLFARTILGKDLYRPTVSKSEYAWVLKAEQALNQALAIQPDHYETQLLLAEVVQRKGNYELAYSMFEKLMDRPEFRSVEFRWRVQAGLGQVALHLEQYDSALASLQEAVQDQPENVFLQHLLAESYALSRLEKQALATARYALKLAPDDLDNLTWFADMMARLAEPLEAIQALRTATQLAPEFPAHWLKLAELYLRLEDTNAARANLKKLLSLNRLDREYLHQAAAAYQSLDDPDAVLECLNKIESPDTGVLLEIAYFAMKTERLEPGMKAIQEAALQNPEETAVYLVEADLLVGLKRLDAALACLEHALHVLETSAGTVTSKMADQWVEITSRGLVSSEWLIFIQTREAIHDRLAKLFRQMGDFASALYHAEQAMEMSPANFKMRLQAAEISEGLLMVERLEKILSGLVVPESTEAIETGSGEVSALAQLLSIKAEIAIDAGKITEAGDLAAQAAHFDPEQSRLLAVQARLAARDGRWNDAEVQLDKCAQSHGVWLGKAAIELYRWDLGLSCLESLADLQPSDLNAQFWLARGLATAALTRKTNAALALSSRLPGEHVISGKAQERFERASSAAAKTSNRDAAHWQIIGRAIYQPGLQTIRTLAAILPGENEATAMVAVLREISNLPGAIQVAEQYHDSPEVLFHLALCYLDQSSMHGLETAQRAAVLSPNLPVYQALLAKLSQAAGENDKALDALETGLNMWPDEPEWHIWASQLAEILGLEEKVVSHWGQALAQVQQRLPYAIAAGKAYLAHHQEHKAIDVLEEASEIDPYRLEIWFLLGKAYFQVGQYKLALNCAEKACQLEPRSVEPALLCGEISLKMGRINEALEWGQKAASLNGKNPEAMVFLAKVFVQRHNPMEGLNIVEKSILQNVVSQEIYFMRAQLVYQLNGVQAALPLLIKLNMSYPDNPQAMKILAQAEMENGDIQAAEQTAFAALRIDPEQPELNLLMGKLKRVAGQLDQSIHYLSETIRQAPAQVDAYLELGQAYMDRREPSQALQVYQLAMKTIPQDYRPFYQSGLILRESKDYRGAETMLRRAAELSPDDLNIRRQLGAVITLNLIHSSQEASSNNESQRATRN